MMSVMRDRSGCDRSHRLVLSTIKPVCGLSPFGASDVSFPNIALPHQRIEALSRIRTHLGTHGHYEAAV